MSPYATIFFIAAHSMEAQTVIKARVMNQIPFFDCINLDAFFEARS